MDYRVGTYLCSSNTIADTPRKCPPKQSLCIAETRPSFWLPKVIQNAQQEFPGWPVYVCAPLDVLQWLATEVPDIVPVVMSGDHSRNTFNQLMYSSQFWDMFETEYVLMFQCDVVFFPGAGQHPVFQNPVHAMYGAACGTLTPDQFVINGGLSFRQVRAFRDAVTRLDPMDQSKHDEDVVFTTFFRKSTYTLPTIEECMRFAIESFGHPQQAIGIHGTDKGYCHPALISAALGTSPRKIVDCVMYDGEPILKTRLALLERIVDQCIVVESRISHSGRPKDLLFHTHFPDGHPKVTYVVIDEFPETPSQFGAEYPWVTDQSRDAWWREQYQRDIAKAHIHSTDPKTMVVVSDVDELPDPDVLLRLARSQDIDAEPVHLHMAFLVYSATWTRPQEVWTRAFACTVKTMPDSFTRQRCSAATGRVVGHAGWHCSSFFDVETHIRKVNHFAHREHQDETDPEVIQSRLQHGNDPYGRAGMDAQESTMYLFLNFI